MLVYAEFYFEPEIYCKVEGGFPSRVQEVIDEVWWLQGCYTQVIDESEVDDYRQKLVEKIKSEANKYHVGEACPFGSFIITRNFIEKPVICPNYKRTKTRYLKDMPTEEVLKVATIPQILQEFGELKIK